MRVQFYGFGAISAFFDLDQAMVLRLSHIPTPKQRFLIQRRNVGLQGICRFPYWREPPIALFAKAGGRGVVFKGSKDIASDIDINLLLSVWISISYVGILPCKEEDCKLIVAQPIEYIDIKIEIQLIYRFHGMLNQIRINLWPDSKTFKNGETSIKGMIKEQN